MTLTDTLMRATIAGARSVVSSGWMREECESAALERLVRHPCLSSAVAYRQGKLAAIDELRSLTQHRRKQGITTVELNTDVPLEEPGFSEVLNNIESEYVFRLCSPRVQKVLMLLMDGYSQVEIARKLGVSPSRINQLISRDARLVKARCGL